MTDHNTLPVTQELKPCPFSEEDVQRFWSRVSKENCWEWTGAKQSRGYGNVVLGGRHYLAHRASLLIAGINLPATLVVDHLCRNRKCVNPQHLRVVTQTINALENTASPCAVNAARTHCIRGHAFSSENTRYDLRGRRRCLSCRDSYRSRTKERAAA